MDPQLKHNIIWTIILVIVIIVLVIITIKIAKKIEEYMISKSNTEAGKKVYATSSLLIVYVLKNIFSLSVYETINYEEFKGALPPF
jgi:hypothetical protein